MRQMLSFAKKIKSIIEKTKKERVRMKNIPQYDPNAEPIFNYQQIEKILPHTFPFLLVDKVIEINENSIVGVKKHHRRSIFLSRTFSG